MSAAHKSIVPRDGAALCIIQKFFRGSLYMVFDCEIIHGKQNGREQLVLTMAPRSAENATVLRGRLQDYRPNGWKNEESKHLPLYAVARGDSMLDP